ncbi:MAG: hypothetical protein A4E68_01571 [Syntrophaceae bacterium PtaB.Bin095]|nr:MAG: hypothetical protein A4E68_01571 [Syntrophaceae bacterium PtaB.Bin095]
MTWKSERSRRDTVSSLLFPIRARFRSLSIVTPRGAFPTGTTLKTARMARSTIDTEWELSLVTTARFVAVLMAMPLGFSPRRIGPGISSSECPVPSKTKAEKITAVRMATATIFPKNPPRINMNHLLEKRKEYERAIDMAV